MTGLGVTDVVSSSMPVALGLTLQKQFQYTSIVKLYINCK
jgi:hypothetical protein